MIPPWKNGFRRGSTVFKEVLDKKGKNVEYYVCAACGFEAEPIVSSLVFNTHEIMHLLQQIRASISSENYEPVFPEESGQ